MNKKIVFWGCLVVLCVFCACIPTSYDFDLFARLIVGERVIEHGIFPFHDFLSYTPTHLWYDHEWGSGVVFYLILKYLGAVGFILFYALAIFGISFFVIKTQKLQKHPFPASIIFMTIFLTFFLRANHNLVRCQLFSFFLFSMFLYFLEKNRKSGTRLIWLIPFLTIFWNNVHGGVVAGLGLVFIYFVGAVLEKKPWKKYFAVLAISSPLLILNPYGVKYLNFLFSATTMTRKFVVEWWPFYKATSAMPAAVSCMAAAAISLFNHIKSKNWDITKFIVIGVTLAEGLIHVKLISLALITVSALCYNDICRFVFRFKKIFIKIEKCLYFAVIVLAVCLIPLFSPLTPRVDLTILPFQEVEFLKINNLKGNIVTPFALGSFVSYKLYPDNLIYLDGRYEEVYNNKEFYIMGDFELADTDNWDTILKDYDTQITMIRKHIPAYKKMQEKEGWIHVYDGTLCGIFIRDDLKKENYSEPSADVSYYRKNVFKGSFGKKIKE